jgi:hypothetical protein
MRKILQKILRKLVGRIQLRSATFVSEFRWRAALISEPLKRPSKRSTDEAI